MPIGISMKHWENDGIIWGRLRSTNGCGISQPSTVGGAKGGKVVTLGRRGCSYGKAIDLIDHRLYPLGIKHGNGKFMIYIQLIMIVDFPSKTHINRNFPVAMFDDTGEK